MIVASIGAAFACSDASSVTVDGSGAEREAPPREARVDAPGGAVVAPLVLADLESRTTGTTPDAIELTLSSNLDSVSVRTRITDRAGVALSGCEVADVYRVGPSAVSWPVGGSLALPLEYGAQLPDGVYVHAVSMGIGAFGNGWLQVNMPQYFEVASGSLRSLTAQEFQAAGGSAEQAPAAPEVSGDPCPPLDDYSDEMTADGATSRVDFDSWQELGTIQPLRWVASATRPFVGPLPSLLVFHALLPNRGRLQLDLMAPADMPSDFDATFPEDGRILLDELGPGAPASWKTLSGRVGVRIDAQGRARVELSDIVFTRSRVAADAAEERTVASGVLAGQVVAEQWP